LLLLLLWPSRPHLFQLLIFAAAVLAAAVTGAPRLNANYVQETSASIRRAAAAMAATMDRRGVGKATAIL